MVWCVKLGTLIDHLWNIIYYIYKKHFILLDCWNFFACGFRWILFRIYLNKNSLSLRNTNPLIWWNIYVWNHYLQSCFNINMWSPQWLINIWDCADFFSNLFKFEINFFSCFDLLKSFFRFILYHSFIMGKFIRKKVIKSLW